MTKQEKTEREREKHDAKALAKIIKDTRRNTMLRNFVGVALSSYMNGVRDTCKSLKAVETMS